jgi:hypothetical protein
MLALWATTLPLMAQSPRLDLDRRDVATESPGWAHTPASSAGAAGASAATGPITPGRDEFGEQQIVQRRAHPEPWSATAGIDFFHSDNVGLTSAHEQGDWYLRTGALVSYTNRIEGPFFADISLEQSFFRYNEFDVLDFDLTRFQAGVLVQLPRLSDSFLFCRYRMERITEAGFGSSLFTEHAIETGLQKVWKISRGQQLFGGIRCAVPIDTDPRGIQRDEYSLSLGYSLRLTERITAGASYRGSSYRYHHEGRADWNHILAAGVTYDAADWLRLGLNFAYTENTSNTSFAEYRSLVPGASLALRIAF